MVVEATRSGLGTLRPMTLTLRAHTALAAVAGALAVALVAAVGPTPTALLTALAATAAVAVVATISLRALVAAPAEGAIRVGHRGHAHRESYDSVAEPAHPDTAGRVRSRAPGVPLPAA